MSMFAKIPRGVRVLLVVVIMAVFAWQLGPETYLYPVISFAALVTLVSIFFIFRTPRAISRAYPKVIPEPSVKPLPVDEDPPTVSADDSLPKIYQRSEFAETDLVAPRTTETASRHFNITTDTRVDDSTMEKLTGQIVVDHVKSTETRTVEIDREQVQNTRTSGNSSAEEAMPMVEDKSSLPLDQKNRLINAVWYRCENPYCKYTHFLGIHHIIDEKDGGTHQLENLIILCPYCHDLAHKNEIPISKMREWIANREERFKFNLDWPY
jgi:5-methylcytosine-specific restriction endonuclease McrA